MWLADQWNDYEVIDCSKGEKLERWGDYLLVRPDPQVIWDTPKKEIAAKVGEQIAKVAQEAGVQAVVFDRNGYLYHGRIKELADAARNGGLKF